MPPLITRGKRRLLLTLAAILSWHITCASTVGVSSIRLSHSYGPRTGPERLTLSLVTKGLGESEPIFYQNLSHECQQEALSPVHCTTQKSRNAKIYGWIIHPSAVTHPAEDVFWGGASNICFAVSLQCGANSTSITVYYNADTNMPR